MATGGDDSDANKRNLVVDEAAFEEQFLRCHICREKFDQNDKPPKSLPCNHTFCLPCLKQVLCQSVFCHTHFFLSYLELESVLSDNAKMSLDC